MLRPAFAAVGPLCLRSKSTDLNTARLPKFEITKHRAHSSLKALNDGY